MLAIFLNSIFEEPCKNALYQKIIMIEIEDLDILFEIILSSYFSSLWFIQKKSRLFLQKIIHICREYFKKSWSQWSINTIIDLEKNQGLRLFCWPRFVNHWPRRWPQIVFCWPDHWPQSFFVNLIVDHNSIPGMLCRIPRKKSQPSNS